MCFFLPTMMPACDAEISLSPEKQITSAPALTDSCTSGSLGRPYFERSTSAPEPKSSTTSTFFAMTSPPYFFNCTFYSGECKTYLIDVLPHCEG
mgnify:CR=1 FL=1